MADLLSAFAKHWATWAVAASWQLALLVVVVALAAWLSRRLSARLRYVLWTLILLKAFLPPTLGMQWSIGDWAVKPAWQLAKMQWSAPAASTPVQSSISTVPPSAPPLPGAGVLDVPSPAMEGLAPTLLPATSGLSANNLMLPNAASRTRLSTETILLIIWLSGTLLFLSLIAFRYIRVKRQLRLAIEVEEGPLRVMLEELAEAVAFVAPLAFSCPNR